MVGTQYATPSTVGCIDPARSLREWIKGEDIEAGVDPETKNWIKDERGVPLGVNDNASRLRKALWVEIL